MRVKRGNNPIGKRLQGGAGNGFAQCQKTIQISDLKWRQGEGRGAGSEILRGLQCGPYIPSYAKGRLQCGVKPIAARICGDLRNINASDGWLGYFRATESVTAKPGRSALMQGIISFRRVVKRDTIGVHAIRSPARQTPRTSGISPMLRTRTRSALGPGVSRPRSASRAIRAGVSVTMAIA